jgi:hypothetical protein
VAEGLAHGMGFEAVRSGVADLGIGDVDDTPE